MGTGCSAPACDSSPFAFAVVTVLKGCTKGLLYRGRQAAHREPWPRASGGTSRVSRSYFKMEILIWT